ncbi:MAG TPA: ATP-binding protein, partial [Thermoanaerobaculia bacterium]|nr:ATP-binding protein [Thermoanaerobaculia bacterium]
MSLPKEIPLPQWEGAFEALMLRLFREVWNDPSAQLIGRRGQKQAGVDVHGEDRARGTGSVGVQCKLHGSTSRVSDQKLLAELNAEVEKAEGFKPPLDHFVFATTAPHSTALQERAGEITDEHRPRGLFSVEFKGWEDIKTLLGEHEIVRAWYLGDWAEPALPDLATGRLPVPLSLLIGREAELDRLDIAWKDPAVHVLVLVAFGGVGKSALVQHWMDSLSAAGWPGARRVFDW